MGRAQPDDRAVLVIEPSALSVPLRQPEQRKDYKGQGEVCLNYAEMPETQRHTLIERVSAVKIRFLSGTVIHLSKMNLV